MKINISLLVALCMTTATLNAQENESNTKTNLEYACNHTLEIQGGPTWNLRSYTNVPSMALGYMGDHATGGGISARYTQFIDKNWGFFLSGEYTSIKSDILWLMRDEGPRQYDYQKDYTCWDWEHGPGYNQVVAGLTHRYDFCNRWSLRTRLGIGYRDMHPDRWYDYDRWDKSLSQPHSNHTYPDLPTNYEKVYVQAVDGDHNPIRRIFSFACSPSIQLCFTPRRHMFFSFEAQWTGTARHLYERIEVYDVKRTKSITTDDVCHCYDYDVTSETLKSTTYHKVRMGNFINVKFGVGWNIGHIKD